MAAKKKLEPTRSVLVYLPESEMLRLVEAARLHGCDTHGLVAKIIVDWLQ